MILDRNRLAGARPLPLHSLLLWLTVFSSCVGPQIQEPSSPEEGYSTAREPSVVVEVVIPKREDLQRQITLSGTIEPFQRARLHSKVAGYLKWISVDIGDRVTKGQILAKLEVPEMADQYSTAQAELGIVESDRTHAEGRSGKSESRSPAEETDV